MTQLPSAVSQRFVRSNRLHLEKDIAAVRTLGKKIRVWPFLVHGLPNQLTRSRVAVTLTKKTGPAVRRNYVRRRVREFFRCCQQELGRFDFVFFSAINLEKISAAEWKKIFENVKKKLVADLRA